MFGSGAGILIKINAARAVVVGVAAPMTAKFSKVILLLVQLTIISRMGSGSPEIYKIFQTWPMSSLIT